MASGGDIPFTLALVAGACAGTSVDVALHPLDTIRTRLQSTKGFLASGGFRGVYRGLLSATLGSSPGAAAFFSTYESMKQGLKRIEGGNEQWYHHSTASSCGEVAACLVRVPTAVVTQRMQIGQYNSFVQAVSSTYSSGGVRAFYVGYGTTVMREIPFSFIQFPLYEGFKKSWVRLQNGEPTNPLQGAACGSVAGAIAGAVTTPLDVAKTRIILENPAEGQPKRYTGAVTTLKLIHAEEGAAALFKGLTPRVTWITIGGFIFFGAYESAQKMLWSTGFW